MSLYVTLYKFTDQGIRNVKDSPVRLETAMNAATTLGIRVLGAYYTMGEYDLVTISDVPNDQVAIASTLAGAALGNVRSTTMKAFTPAEFAEIVKKLP